jgi:transposase
MDVDESIRLEAFRQLKKDIRGSEEYLIVGIDIAKDTHKAFFGTATGKTLLRRLVFENTIDGFGRLRARTAALKVQHCLKKVVYGMEPTANYHKPLAEYLIKGGHHVVLVSGMAVNKNRELLDGRWDKHDTKDSANVADLVSQAKCLYYDYPSPQLRDLRSLLSLKRRLKKQEHGVKVRIRNHLLAQYFPELDRYVGKRCSESLAIVKWCVNPSMIASMEYDEFVHLIAPHRRSIGQEKRLKSIWEMAIDSIGCEVGHEIGFEAQLMVDELQRLRDTIHEVDEHIEDSCMVFPEYSYLLTIPGFGPDVSSKVLGAIGNPFRFDNGKQVLKLTGYDLGAHRSGKTSERAVPVISKRGKAYL